MSGVGGPRMWAGHQICCTLTTELKDKGKTSVPSLSQSWDSVIQPLGSEFQSLLPLDYGLSAYPYLTLVVGPLALY